jgi:hypothetical protein
MAGIARTQKDEQKSKKFEDPFIQILLKILQDSYLEPVIFPVTDALHDRIPSQILLGLLSLIHVDAYQFIRDSHTDSPVRVLFSSSFRSEEILKDLNHIPVDVRTDFNAWMSSMVLLFSRNYSILQLQRFQTDHIHTTSESLSKLIFTVLELYFLMHYGSIQSGVLEKLSLYIFKQIDTIITSLELDKEYSIEFL